jgi:hypothetical protein
MNAMKPSGVQEVPEERKENKRILFAAPSFRSFIKKDYKILKRKSVKCVVYSYRHKKPPRLLVPRIIRGVLWADLTYSWFGSFHAFFTFLFSKILYKKSIVVAGGYDIAKIACMQIVVRVVK